MARRDYRNDPDAPAANSLVPAVSTVVVDESGRILLQRRRDNGMWALPGAAARKRVDDWRDGRMPAAR